MFRVKHLGEVSVFAAVLRRRRLRRLFAVCCFSVPCSLRPGTNGSASGDRL